MREKVAGLEALAKEQDIGKCIYCGTVYRITGVKRCSNCGQPVIYQKEGES